jgi:hypothetical protein
MPKRAFVADVEIISSQVSSGALPYVKQIQYDNDNDIVTVELLYKALTLPLALSIICGGMACERTFMDRPEQQ